MNQGILREFIRWLPRYFFPKNCYGCGKEGDFVCSECRGGVKRTFDSPICPECRNPSPRGIIHEQCRNKWRLDRLTSYYHYSGWAKEIVREAKFRKRWEGLEKLSEELAGNLYQKIEGNWLVVPIPLHWWRERKRGFNQAGLIAKKICKVLNFTLNEGVLVRVKYTEAQTLIENKIKINKKMQNELEKKYPSTTQRKREIKKLIKKIGARERKKNVRGAFVVDEKFQIPAKDGTGKNLKLGRNIILVDDVWTTGATMQECCRVLKRAGVKKVWGLTLLRV